MSICFDVSEHSTITMQTTNLLALMPKQVPNDGVKLQPLMLSEQVYSIALRVRPHTMAGCERIARMRKGTAEVMPKVLASSTVVPKEPGPGMS
jgi:hypothetical protein